MSPLVPLLLGLLSVAGLTYFCATHHGPHFEADLSQRSQQALASAGLPKIATSAEGQIITLRGEVADEETKRKAGQEATRVFGVEEVRNLLIIRPLPPPAPAMTRLERVAAENCQVTFNRLLKQETVRYASGSATIDRSSYRLLDRIAAAAKGCPAASIEIGGHTDSKGALAMNVKLSEDRARAVMSYLQRKGVAADKLTAVGYGPNQPLATNNTPNGMQQNRRTELKVKGLTN